jgi:hypothetical protein
MVVAIDKALADSLQKQGVPYYFKHNNAQGNHGVSAQKFGIIRCDCLGHVRFSLRSPKGCIVVRLAHSQMTSANPHPLAHYGGVWLQA